MELMPQEETLIISDGEKIIVTNHRIVSNIKEFGKKLQTNIFLEDIASIEINFKCKPWLKILGILCVVICIPCLNPSFNIPQEVIPASLLTSIVLLFIYYVTCKHVLKISSKGGAYILFEVDKMNNENVNDFVTKLCTAKQNRISNLRN